MCSYLLPLLTVQYVPDSAYVRNVTFPPAAVDRRKLSRPSLSGQLTGVIAQSLYQLQLPNRLRLDPAKHRLSTTKRSADLPRACTHGSGPGAEKLPRSPEGKH